MTTPERIENILASYGITEADVRARVMEHRHGARATSVRFDAGLFPQSQVLALLELLTERLADAPKPPPVPVTSPVMLTSSNVAKMVFGRYAQKERLRSLPESFPQPNADGMYEFAVVQQWLSEVDIPRLCSITHCRKTLRHLAQCRALPSHLRLNDKRSLCARRAQPLDGLNDVEPEQSPKRKRREQIPPLR